MSYWDLTRKMKAAATRPKPIPIERPHWQHWAIWAAEGLGITAASVGLVLALVRMPDPTPVTPTAEAQAWDTALALAKATPAERKTIPHPPTLRYPNVRATPIEASRCPGLKDDEQCMNRLCGMTEYFLTLGPDGELVGTTITSVFLRTPSEDALLGPILTHEYLHTIWLQRAAHDPMFYAMNPNSEKWVAALVPARCPSF